MTFSVQEFYDLYGETPERDCDVEQLEEDCPNCGSKNFYIRVAGVIPATYSQPGETYGTEFCTDCGYQEEV